MLIVSGIMIYSSRGNLEMPADEAARGNFQKPHGDISKCQGTPAEPDEPKLSSTYIHGDVYEELEDIREDKDP